MEKDISVKGRIIFVLGGAKSGKSRFALEKADLMGGKKLYIATAQALDCEMEKRIEKHRLERGEEWVTIEEPLNIAGSIEENKDSYNVILIDCLTLWLNNLMGEDGSELQDGKAYKERFLIETESLIDSCIDSSSYIIIVSNEVGLGIVPENFLARRFRDIAGGVNRRVANAADEVFFLMSGIPLRLK